MRIKDFEYQELNVKGMNFYSITLHVILDVFVEEGLFVLLLIFE